MSVTDYPGSFWTTEKDAQLRELFSEGLSFSAIATRMGCVSRNAAIGRAGRMGLKRILPAPLPRPKTDPAATLNIRRIPSGRPPRARAMPEEPYTGPVIPLLSLEAHHCRWPIGNVGDEGFGFCGANRRDGKAYCGAHSRIAFVPAKTNGKELARSLRRFCGAPAA